MAQDKNIPQADNLLSTFQDRIAANRATIERYEEVLRLIQEDVLFQGSAGVRELERFGQELTEQIGGKVAKLKLINAEFQRFIDTQ